jgi:hypothetical protein
MNADLTGNVVDAEDPVLALEAGRVTAVVEDQRFPPVLEEFIAECGAVVACSVCYGVSSSKICGSRNNCATRASRLRLVRNLARGVYEAGERGATALGLPTLTSPMFRDLPRSPFAGEGDDEGGRDG